MSDNAELAQRFFAAIEAGDWEQVKALVTDDFTCIGPVPSPTTLSIWLDFQQAVHHAFPDWSYNLRDVKADADVVELKVHITATHSQKLSLPLHSVPPLEATGKRIELPDEQAKLTFRDGKICKLETQSAQGGGAEGILAQLREEV